MGVLILLIVLDLVIVGVVMYFVMAEKPTQHEHYIPNTSQNSSQHTPAGAMTDTSPETPQPREWAVQTVDDSEAAAQAESAEDVETLPVAADDAPAEDETQAAPRDE